MVWIATEKDILLLYELDTKDYYRIADLFTRLRSNTAVAGIIGGKSRARVLVDSSERPQSVFVINSWSYYYLAGSSSNEEFNLALVQYLNQSYFPECIRDGKNVDFAFYPDSEEWLVTVRRLFPNLRLEESGKTYFLYETNRFHQDWRSCIPEGFAIERISEELLASGRNKKEIVEYIEYFWGTIDRFFQNGLGYCAVNSTDFASICLSVFASENEREVGIKTFSPFLERGLAYVTACAYIEECLKKNYTPTWSCFSENEVSVKLAEKLGYRVESRHPILFASIGESGGR